MDSTLPLDSETSRRSRKGHGRVTLHEIAEAAGVTRITVSRYLRQPGVVAAATAEKIQAAIDQLGYVANQQAGTLASGYSRVVVAIVPNIGHSVFAETVQGISDGLSDSGFELMLMASGYSQERETAQLRAALGWSPAALVMTGRQHAQASLELVAQVLRSGTAVVQLWDYQERADEALSVTAQIGFNHFDAGSDMARYLMGLGHRHLAYVDTGVAQDFRAHERAAGFLAACRSQGAVVHMQQVAGTDFFAVGRDGLERVRAAHPLTSAVAFANDQMACGALVHAQLVGLAVPQQMALLGFGDFPLGRVLAPQLSTWRPPSHAMGMAAAQTVLAHIREQPCVASQPMPCEPVIRAST